MCYDEVDPLPQVSKKLSTLQLPEEAKQVVPHPDVRQLPIARAAQVRQRYISQSRDWEDWCNTVKYFMAKNSLYAIPIVAPIK